VLFGNSLNLITDKTFIQKLDVNIYWTVYTQSLSCLENKSNKNVFNNYDKNLFKFYL
jgi:hypothetical protein